MSEQARLQRWREAAALHGERVNLAMNAGKQRLGVHRLTWTTLFAAFLVVWRVPQIGALIPFPPHSNTEAALSAIAALTGNHKARQSQADHWHNCRTGGLARLTAKKSFLAADGISGRTSATTILPSVTFSMPHYAFDLGSMESDILQRMIVERLQLRHRQPCLPLLAHP